MSTENLVSIHWLNEHLEYENIVIADCRFDLGDPEKGREQFTEGHIPGAVYFDLEKDLSGLAGTHGGRHPLPVIDDFVEKLNRVGIDEAKHVVAYDDQGGAMAARLWWMLIYLGHEKVSILEEGYGTWVKQGHPVARDERTVERRNFVPRPQPEMIVDINDVKKKKADKGTVLIDARAPDRFRGDVEPMDSKAGHIPGAENWFWKNNLGTDGKWKSADELKKRFEALNNKEEIIAYCGSGVTASANVLALKEAGMDKVKLYVGSWSDWSSCEDNPVETGQK